MVHLDKGAVQVLSKTRALHPDALLAYEDFFRSKYTELLRVARYVGASPEEADEAAQQVMIEVYQNWLTIEKRWPWARRAVVSTYLKVRQREAERLARTARGGHITSAGYDDTDMTVWEDSQWVNQVLGRLPPAQREVMTFVVEGWKPAEIALMLGKTADTVRQNLKFARDRLEQELRRQHAHEVAAPPGRPLDREEVR